MKSESQVILLSTKKIRLLVLSFMFCFFGVLAWPLSTYSAAAAPKVTIEWLIKPQLKWASDFGCGVAWVQEKSEGMWKQIDTSGRVLIDKYKAFLISRYDEETKYAPFINHQRLNGYINLSGDIVITPQYKFGVGFKDGVAVVQQKKEDLFYEGVIDRHGNIVLPFIYESVKVIHNNLFAVKYGSRWGYVDGKGNMITDYIFDRPHSLGYFSNVFSVVQNEKVGLLDTSGKWVLPASFDHIYTAREGLTGLEKDGKVGFVDASGKTMIDFVFEGVSVWYRGSYYTFSDGLAVIMISKEKNVSGVIDKSGALLFQFEGMARTPFVNGLLMAHLDDRYRLIDREGNSYPLPPNVDIGVLPPVRGLEEGVLRVRPLDEAKQSPAGGNFGYLKISVR